MLVYLVFILALCFCGLRYSKNPITDSFSINQTNAIKGIAISVVFFNHIFGYLVPQEVITRLPGDGLFQFVINQTTQLMVGIFLFMSGYGIFFQYQKKGHEYIKNIPKNRVLNTLLNFDVAVLIFAVIILLMGSPFELTKFCFSLLAWESIGNSNWYIFAILYCYISTYLSFRFVYKLSVALIFQIGLILVYLLIMPILKPGLPWWYMTILCYPAGMLYSKYKTQIATYLSKTFYLKVLILVLLMGFLLLFSSNYFLYNLAAIIYCFIWVSICTHITLDSKILSWCGKNLFFIYIYQRLPMLAISTLMPQIITNPYTYAYIVLCIVITVVIAKYMPMIKIK